jgi:hypothetical protein
VDAHNLDAELFMHQVDKGIVFLPRLARPDHIVKQQLSRVRRRQAPHLQARPVNNHLP